MADQLQQVEERVEQLKRELAAEQDKLSSLLNANSAEERVHQDEEP